MIGDAFGDERIAGVDAAVAFRLRQGRPSAIHRFHDDVREPTFVCDRCGSFIYRGVNMAEINERRIVHRPESEASHRLAAFVAERRLGDGSLDVALRLPLEILAAFRLPIERRGVASFYSLQSAADPRPTYSVSWTSTGGWPFPDFAGALAVEQVLLPDCFGLVLRGYYGPLLTRAEPSLDSETDWRIAHGLTHELLRSIAEYIESPPAPHARESRRASEGLPFAS